MKPAGLSLLAFVVTGILAAQSPAPPQPVRTSPRLSQEIRAGLPVFVPPVVKPPSDPEESAVPPSDPDILKLPKFVIREKRPPGNDPDVWLTERTVQQKAMVAYKTSMTDLEWALNSWFIPLFSAPPSVRARQYYESRKLSAEIERLDAIIKTVGLTDPQEAARLKDAMDPQKLPKEN
jgi:hypothetical protein